MKLIFQINRSQKYCEYNLLQKDRTLHALNSCADFWITVFLGGLRKISA